MGRKPRIVGRYSRAHESHDQYLRRVDHRRLRALLGGAYTLGLVRPEMDYEPLIALFGRTDLGNYILMKLLFESIIQLTFDSVIIFTSPERLRLSCTQWRTLFKLTYGIYATGGRFHSRPEAILRGSSLEINFATALEFTEFHQRALGWTSSHLIDFNVEIYSPHRILGRISANHTPVITVVEPEGPPESDPRVLTLQIDHRM